MRSRGGRRPRSLAEENARIAGMQATLAGLNSIQRHNRSGPDQPQLGRDLFDVKEPNSWKAAAQAGRWRGEGVLRKVHQHGGHGPGRGSNGKLARIYRELGQSERAFRMLERRCLGDCQGAG